MSTTYAITFGDRLRRTRLNLGLDQRQLADALDVHHATISRYEHNGGKDDAPTRRMARLVELHYGIDAEWLLYGSVPGQRRTPVTQGYREASEARTAQVIDLADYRAQRTELPMAAGM